MSSTRDEVYAAIDGERDYQNSKWNEDVTESGGRHTVTEWLVFIQDYVQEALRTYTRELDPEATDFVKHTLRKVAGMSVAALEEHGVLTREVEGHRPVGTVR